MPVKPSILDLMRTDLETSELSKPPPTPERTPPTTIRWDYDYIRDEPPTVQRIPEEPQQHSTPRADPHTPSIRPRPTLELPRPRASSAPPAAHPAKRLALQYLPVTEEITPPITPPRAQPRTPDKAIDIEVVPDTPSLVKKHGRSRG